MPRKYIAPHQFTLSELLLLVTLISIWLGITVLTGTYSLLVWGLGVLMAAILRPAHQRPKTPESATDVMSVAVGWSVACGAGGCVLDVTSYAVAGSSVLSWTFLGQCTGFYLGMVWVLVVLLVRQVEKIVERVDRAHRPQNRLAWKEREA